MSKKQKKLEPICRNCRLFDEANGLCRVVVVQAVDKELPNRFNLPVSANDQCFFENKFVALDESGQKEAFNVEVQQVKWWVEDPKTGQKTDGNGRVKIEYPEGFFGAEE